MSGKVYCLHGFLGLPSDWDFLGTLQETALEKVDIFQVLSPATAGGIKPAIAGASMMDWAEVFNHQVSQKPEKRILLGYSMGGRLALHALVRNPSLWAGAIIVSANPEPLPEERAPRLIADENWAQRFENEPWDQVVSAWENHPVYGAPFGAAWKDDQGQNQGLAVVGIRNVQWLNERILLCAGCGVIAESEFEREWQEVNGKMRAIKGILAL